MKALEIKSELEKTQSKITELETAREGQTAAVEATEKAFIDGTADIAKLNNEQGELSILTQTIASLRSTYQRLTSAFGNQSEAEARREQIKQMVNAANSVPILVDDYLKTRSEFNLIVEKYAAILVGKNEAYRVQQDLYRSIVRELQPTDAEIKESGLDQMTRTMAATSHINHPPTGTFDEAVSLAEKLLAAKLNKAARSERIAAFHARTNAASAE
jgi:hypothetical protein